MISARDWQSITESRESAAKLRRYSAAQCQLESEALELVLNNASVVIILLYDDSR